MLDQDQVLFIPTLSTWRLKATDDDHPGPSTSTTAPGQSFTLPVESPIPAGDDSDASRDNGAAAARRAYYAKRYGSHYRRNSSAEGSFHKRTLEKRGGEASGGRINSYNLTVAVSRFNLSFSVLSTTQILICSGVCVGPQRLGQALPRLRPILRQRHQQIPVPSQHHSRLHPRRTGLHVLRFQPQRPLWRRPPGELHVARVHPLHRDHRRHGAVPDVRPVRGHRRDNVCAGLQADLVFGQYSVSETYRGAGEQERGGGGPGGELADYDTSHCSGRCGSDNRHELRTTWGLICIKWIDGLHHIPEKGGEGSYIHTYIHAIHIYDFRI